MSLFYLLSLLLLLGILSLAAYVDRVYSEMGKFLAREYQDNIDAWERVVEPRLRLSRESLALSASVLRQLTLAAIALLSGLRLYAHNAFLPTLVHIPGLPEIARTAFELILLILLFDRLVPQVLFTRTRGLWIARIRILVQTLFFLVLPITMLLSLLLSIAALAEPEDKQDAENPSQAMDALLEAGEEEGILEESDRELVRSVVEFGDKLVREIMTPRPELFAVPGALTLKQFKAELAEHPFSRVPVFASSIDDITGIAFAHDLLHIPDTEAETKTVSQLQRPAAFVPETKNTAELLREMQREKQHMRFVIDEYGSVAGLVTIEDLLEAIVGEIADEHDEPEDDDTPVPSADGSWVVTGTFELSRLRDLLRDQPRDPAHAAAANPATAGAPSLAPAASVARIAATRTTAEPPGATSSASGATGNPTGGTPATRVASISPRSTTLFASSPANRPDADEEELPALTSPPTAPAPEDGEFDPTANYDPDPDALREEHLGNREDPALRIGDGYEATTVGGLVSEIAGHIPLPGEVVEEDGLRLEVLASTDRRIDRIRVSISHPATAA